MEMPLAEAALRSGAANEFDQRIQSLEARSRRILSCTPRDSFVWLLVFDLEVLHGRLNEHSFNLLAMSYETSPNEAWISIRRIIVAMPLVLIAPDPVRKSILFEFQQLIRNGFLEDAVRSYMKAPGQFVRYFKIKLNSWISVAKKPSQKRCENSPPERRLFRKAVFVVRPLQEITLVLDGRCVDQPEPATFVQRTVRCMVAVGVISTLFRAGAGGLSGYRDYS